MRNIISGTVPALWAASHSVKVRVGTKRCSVKGFLIILMFVDILTFKWQQNDAQ